MKHVLFIREMRDELREYLENALLDIDIQLHFSRDIPIEDVNCIVGWRPNIEDLQKAKKLELFINPGTGVQHLMGEIPNVFKKQKVILVNGHGSSFFTAQHCVALLFSLSNQLFQHHNWMKQGLWRRGDSYAKSKPIGKMHIGLLGYGAINQKVHQFLAPFKPDISIMKRSISSRSDFETKGIALYHLNDMNIMFPQLDAVIISLPLTHETQGCIGDEQLGLLKPGAILINIGRGGLIEEAALYQALKENRITAGIDVWYDYSPDEVEGKRYPYDENKHPFHDLDNIILSPHRAASPFDDLNRWNEVIYNLKQLVDKKEYINIVDLDLGY